MLISDWSSDVCSSDLALLVAGEVRHPRTGAVRRDPGRTAWLAHVEMAVEKTRRVRAYGLTCRRGNPSAAAEQQQRRQQAGNHQRGKQQPRQAPRRRRPARFDIPVIYNRSEEHTSELQSLMRISYAVFCLKKKQNQT